jgi:hypothetical protein
LVGQQTMTLESGQLVRFSTGEWEEPVPVDALQMTEWMLPLLALRGGHDREFSGHVTALLSRIGTTKLDYVREERLVELGEPAAVPLIAYLRDPDAVPDPARRARAARIIAKTAPLESLPDLVELLNDPLGQVRVAAAQALHRLTGLDHGVPVEEWSGEGDLQKAGVARWREWLSRRV